MSPKLYVGCGLTFAPESFKDEVERTKDALRADWEVMEFLGLTAGTAADVYRQDIIVNVGTCDAFIGICDEPSTGLGWELSTAVRKWKPTLATAQVGTKITRLVEGAPSFNPTMTLMTYENMSEDIPRMAAELLLPQLQFSNKVRRLGQRSVYAVCRSEKLVSKLQKN